MLDFLPACSRRALERFDFGSVREIRLRCGGGLHLNVGGKNVYADYGGEVVTRRDLEKAMVILTEHSVYAHAETLKSGFVTTEGGVRVGVCGTAVVENGEVKMFKKISALCVRLPREVKGASDYLMRSVFAFGAKSVLIISPPGKGKTTLLRDAVRNLSDKFSLNVLVVDERSEIAAEGFDLGKTTDVLSGVPKEYGLEEGIRTLAPDVIAVDELITSSHAEGVARAKLSGTEVIATVHGEKIDDVRKKKIFSALFEAAVFDYAVIIRNVGRDGEIVKLGDR